MRRASYLNVITTFTYHVSKKRDRERNKDRESDRDEEKKQSDETYAISRRRITLKNEASLKLRRRDYSVNEDTKRGNVLFYTLNYSVHFPERAINEKL